jgi:hypothetical protein
MRFPVLLASAALTFLAACGSNADTTPAPGAGSSTTQPGSTSTAPSGGATTDSGADPNSSFVALIDLATGNQITVFDGPGSWTSWFEKSGEAITALATSINTPPHTIRIAVDGTPLHDSATELQVRVNADGDARAYGGPYGDGVTFKTYLALKGELVSLQGDPTALPLGFSPQGDRLLSYTAVPAPEGEAALSYVVHNLDGTVQSVFVNHLSATQPGYSPAAWSSSGKYIATIGLEGMILHDIHGGGAILVTANGSTEWSPTEDSLLIVTPENGLQIFRTIDLSTTSIDVDVNGISASFDPTGRVVTVSNGLKSITTIFDAQTGEQIVEWRGVAEAQNNLGYEPVTMTDDGPTALVQSTPDCATFLVIHPLLDGAGECIDGHSARWSPDASAISFTRGSNIIVLDIATLTERTVATDVPTTLGGTLARWNEAGTHLLLEWPWGGAAWADTLQ